MKRYLLFVGNNYYAKGGFLDYEVTSDSEQKLVDLGNKRILNTADREKTADWWHIVDTRKMKISSYCQGTYCGTTPRKDMWPEDFKKYMAVNAVEHPFPTGK